MRYNYLKASLKTAILVTSVLLLGAGLAVAQQQINLTAGAASVTLPDGSTVPMWGYTCGAVVSGSTASCAKLNPAATGWSPVVITVPTGQGLTINLTNHLTFTGGNLPTSLVVVGQLGGGLGTPGGFTPAPDHSNAQGQVTWPIVDPTTSGTPPAQGQRVRSFSTEVAATTTTASVPLTWAAATLRPGTYLIESGTHPSIQGPMGLYGMLVVTTAPTAIPTVAAGTAYPAVGTTPAVTYNADVPLLMSEIDPVQNNAVQTAVNTSGFSETAVWSGRPGACGAASVHTCYPPAVNYTPLYYLFNGVAFDKTSAGASLFPASPALAVTGNVLVRLVNAGLRMHVPSIVGAQTGTAASGFSLIAEDGNRLPGIPRVQSEVFMAAGKTYDVMINVPPVTTTSALPVFDRQLSLSGNATARDAGMLAYISINGAGVPVSPALATALANPDTYNSVITGKTLVVSDPAKGVIANDVNVYGVKVVGTATGGTLTLNTNGTFTFAATAASGSFTYCGNGATSGAACATVTLGAATIEAAGGITVVNDSYTSNVATALSIKSPGILANDKDAAGYPLTVALPIGASSAGLTLSVDKSGSFNASVAAPGTYTFAYKAQNSQGTVSSATGTVTLIFPAPSNLAVTVKDPGTNAIITDYRWIIEEDRTFYINPACTTNPPPAGCPTAGGIVPTFGTNFHTSYMPVVATGCTGTLSCESGQTLLGTAAVCDGGNGGCRTTAGQQTAVNPNRVHLDPLKRYYISVLPGDAANPVSGASDNGHGMGGAPIAAAQTSVTVLTQITPFQPANLSVFVFEDDRPVNGENDAGGGALGGGVDGVAANEPGLGGFEITLFDDAGGSGDATGQMTYDMFNMPLSNSLAGTIDPVTGKDACPISKLSRLGINTDTGAPGAASATGITAMIVTCPNFEADGTTYSPLAGQAVVANLMPGRYGVVATPAADRIGRGEEWLQTNTLDGQKAHDSFLRVGEPTYFQEYGPAGYHVSIGFANPKIINDRLAGVCAGVACTSSVTGVVTTERMSRTPDERLYSSGTNDSFAFTQCYVSIGDPDDEDFAFTKCDETGKFTLSGLPSGNWRITVFDQWNDMLVDGLSTPVALNGGATNLGDIAMNQWQANIYTSTFFDQDGNGVRGPNEPGLSLVATNIRFRDGSFSNFNNTDLSGNAGFNEIFPLFSWYVIETDSTRYKNTGTHVVYDAGGPADDSAACGQAGYPPCGPSPHTISANMANSAEPAAVALPTNLRVPGALYCSNADCNGFSISARPAGGGPGGSTGRIDPPWVTSEGWQGFSGQNSFIEFGKTPFAAGENGGIHGHVVYASTRPFDDPALLLQLSWEPQVPHVTMNLYQEGTAADGSPSLKLVDTTQTSSFDDWAQGFRSDNVPNMNCPGQSTADLFYFTLQNQPMYLNPGTPVPNNSQFKCYDGMHNWNQVQPAPYDGAYQFPSIVARNPQTGVPVDPSTGRPAATGTPGSLAGTNCTICTANSTDNTPMLPAGKYVVEVVVPPGYELVKEEDKNILIGDTYIAPVTQQFAGLGNIFILPDQAAVGSTYNGYNSQNATTDLGVSPRHEGDTGSVETFWPCVGQARVVPDYISLFPQSLEVSPFAGATRNLCDRKEVTLDDQTAALAKFYVFTSTHVAAHFTGVITDDFTSEFDPFSPQFGEKFAPPNMPISIKDFAGNEIARTYTDQWGAYNGLNYSTWEVNPPNPTGYAPQMMVTCMNDPGTGPTPDALFNPDYSQFCYEIPFMPGQTQYMDTPVTPTSAYAGAGYNNPDCAYPDATPAIKEVDGDGIGPYVSASGHTLTITSLGIQSVNNYAYSGPQASTAPYNQKTVTRNFGFGGSAGTVTIGGVPATLTGTGWTNAQITVTVPANVPVCTLQQQIQFGGPATSAPARCGELLITAANGKQSIDTVTVTVGGKAPTHVLASGSIQTAIDAASPGDLIMIDPTCTTTTGPVACTTAGATKSSSAHNEMLLMWKPVRLQGVGAASSILNANTHPAGKLDPWRRQVLCLFGLSLNARPISASNPYDPSATPFTCSTAMQFQVDRIPLEPTVGWDASLNGNLAEQLQEPSLMGAYEGAGITVLAKGVRFPTTAGTDPFGTDTFPDGTVLLTGSTSATTGCGPNTASAHIPFRSNFQCNPSSIDGLAITDSSQGGGGIFVHGWAHNLQIANNRIYNNSGTLAGGIAIGQSEFPDPYLLNGTTPNAAPGSCTLPPSGTGTAPPSATTNTQQPYCMNVGVNVHNNAITSNSSLGDELFSSTPSGSGGVAFCTGADNYKFNFNWICGNLSTGDGGGVSHLGFSYNGDIEHNSILFNQSNNPTVPTNGGGLAVLGAPDTDPVCGNEAANPDADCAPGTSDGTGPNLVINANLIQGNTAESGSGGGIRLHGVNGTELTFFPTSPTRWNSVYITNNIIANNVAGWDGAGVSLQDALSVNLINNTIISNDTTASAGVLFNTLGAPLSSSPPPPTTTSGTGSAPQPAGVVAIKHSPTLMTTLAGLSPALACPTTHPNCRQLSNPVLDNNVFWQNRSYYIGVGALSAAYQQNIVTLYNSFTTTAAPSQPQADAATPNPNGGATVTGGTGACTSASYWDIGVRGDTGPGNHGSGFSLAPTYSLLTNTGATSENGVGSNNSFAANPSVVSQYCNGSRVPPENTAAGAAGWQVPPGIADATVPNPPFTLAASATVDEGNNWVNMSWGPLSLTNPTVTGASPLGNYALASSGSPAVNKIPSSAGGTNGAYTLAPPTDFFGHARKANNFVDAGAVEFGAAPVALAAAVNPNSAAFGNWATGTTSAPISLTVTNTGSGALAGGSFTFGSTAFARSTSGTFPTGAPNCGTTLVVGASCTIKVTFTPAGTGAVSSTLTVAFTNATVTPTPVPLSGTGVANRPTMTITPNPLSITLPSGSSTGTGTLTVTNTAATGGSQLAITNVAVNGSGSGTNFLWVFNGGLAAGPDTCTGAAVAPLATCTVTVRFSTIGTGTNGRGVTRSGTAVFTDNATTSPQTVNLSGFATP